MGGIRIFAADDRGSLCRNGRDPVSLRARKDFSFPPGLGLRVVQETSRAAGRHLTGRFSDMGHRAGTCHRVAGHAGRRAVLRGERPVIRICPRQGVPGKGKLKEWGLPCQYACRTVARAAVATQGLVRCDATLRARRGTRFPGRCVASRVAASAVRGQRARDDDRAPLPQRTSLDLPSTCPGPRICRRRCTAMRPAVNGCREPCGQRQQDGRRLPACLQGRIGRAVSQAGGGTPVSPGRGQTTRTCP